VEKVKDLKKQIIAYENKVKQERLAVLKTDAENRIKEGKVQNPEVMLLDAGSNNKILNDVLKIYAKKSKETHVLLFSVDEGANKVLCLAQTPKGSGLKANEWVGSCSGVIDGKGGGRDTQAQASGTNVAKVQEAISLAKAFAAEKL